MDVLDRPLAAPGVYWGNAEGIESGTFVGRIEVRPVLSAATLHYEAFGESGLQHVEHAVLARTHSGLSIRTVIDTRQEAMTFDESEPGVFRLQNGPDLRIVIEVLKSKLCPTPGGMHRRARTSSSDLGCSLRFAGPPDDDVDDLDQHSVRMKNSSRRIDSSGYSIFRVTTQRACSPHDRRPPQSHQRRLERLEAVFRGDVPHLTQSEIKRLVDAAISINK